MPVINTYGYNYIEGAAEMLRLFYGYANQVSENRAEANSDTIIINSRVIELNDAQADKIIVETDCTGLNSVRTEVKREKFRREIKRQLYCQLELLTDIHFPWGSLTGVRPTQIIFESFVLCEYDNSKTIDYLTDYWRLSPAKAELGLITAIAEQGIMSKLDKNDLFVYAGVPFCPGRCSYCSFISRDAFRQADWLEPYADTVVLEAKLVFEQIKRPVSALYLGGGTPTSLPDGAFARLLEGLVRYVPLKQGAEWTVEAGRPDTISKTKLDLIRQAGANRICINPQTMNDETLRRIRRNHTAAQTIEAYEMAREAGFSHINMDLIAGLPGESPEQLLRSLNELLMLGPESITIHTLALKRSSHLQEQSQEAVRLLHLPQAELSAAIAEAGSRLRENDFYPYYLYRQKEVAGGLENTGFARPGQACVYNVAMMSDRFDVIGLGSGAISKRVDGTRVRRSPNSKDLLNYQQRIEELARRKIDLFNL